MARKASVRMMIPVLLVCLVSACLVLGSGCRSFPEISGPYLGQQPPGATPVRFAPEVISEELHSVTVFSPDGTEVFWGPLSGWQGSGRTPHLRTTRVVDGLWTKPAGAPFPGSSDSTALSADGNRVFYLSRTGVGADERIWYADRADGGWSEPAPLEGAIASTPAHWQLSVAANGDLYFSRPAGADPSPDIYRAELVDGKYDKVTRLGPTINTDCWEYSPYIARDGSYLLFSRANAGRTDCDLYVSFPAADGSWGEAIKLPSPINGSGFDHCAWVSDDGKYLFFLSSRDGPQVVYWVDAGVIETLRPR